MAVILKDPSAVLDYTHDWDDEYLLGGETISTSTWAVSPSGLTIDSESETTTTTTVWVSGGTAGKVYLLTNTVTTSASRTEQRTLTIRVEDR